MQTRDLGSGFACTQLDYEQVCKNWEYYRPMILSALPEEEQLIETPNKLLDAVLKGSLTVWVSTQTRPGKGARILAVGSLLIASNSLTGQTTATVFSYTKELGIPREQLSKSLDCMASYAKEKGARYLQAMVYDEDWMQALSTVGFRQAGLMRREIDGRST